MTNTRIIWATRIILAACFSLFLGAACAGEEGLWMTDFAAAKAKAKAEKKLLLLDFTGSDWCGWCIKLHHEVFDLPAFITEAPKKFVLVELDYPHTKPQTPEIKAQNQELQQHFKITGFPTVYVTDAGGNAIAKTGYRDGGPEKYVQELNGFATAHETIVTMKAKLASAKGLDKAKMLDQILAAEESLGLDSDDETKYSAEILTLDADNKAGLKAKYTIKTLLAEADHLGSESKFDEAKEACEKAIKVIGITPAQKLDAYFAEGGICFGQKDFTGVVACLTKARAAAPESPKVKQIDGLLKRYQPVADAQTAVTKLKADAETKKGIDRAKLLDQLVDAQARFDGATQSRTPSPDIAKWTQEIMLLDATNKAGLKTKYEFKIQLGEATRLYKAKDYANSTATLAKALALPGLTEEQKASAQKLKTDLEAQKANPGAAPSKI